MTASEPSGGSARPWKGTEIPVAGTVPGQVPAETHVGATGADAAVTELYSAHYRSLVRLAVLLSPDSATAEEVVQDSFAAMYVGRFRMCDAEEALSCLRRAVVRRCRSAWRHHHHRVVNRNATRTARDMPISGHAELVALEWSAVLAALRWLPHRQREVVVLRYYGNLSEAQIAATIGIAPAAVNRHASRAMAGLRAVLERGP
jgi:RNA polymerase sigma factor (sigma-70 family)